MSHNNARSQAPRPPPPPPPIPEVVQGKRQIRWNDGMDKILVGTLFDIITVLGKGSQNSNVSKKDTLVQVASVVTNSGSQKVDWNHVRSRLRSLRGAYTVAAELLGQSGFSFNHQTKYIQADADVWERYIQAHPAAASYKIKWLPNYEMLDFIYGNDSANGSGNFNAHDPDAIPILDDETDDNDPVNVNEYVDNTGDATQGSGVNVEAESPRQNSNGQKKKKPRIDVNDEKIAKTFEHLAEAAKAMADNLKRPPSMMQKVHDALKGLELSKENFKLGMTFLGNSPNMGEIFLSFDDEDLRKEWLLDNLPVA